MALQKTEQNRWETEIDGKTYSFEKWGAEESLESLIKLSKIIGKPLSLFIGDMLGDKKEDSLFEKKGLDKQMNPDMVKAALEALIENLEEKSCIALVKKFAAHKVLCDGIEIKNFSLHYEDQLPHLFKVVMSGIEVQYGNFFDGFRSSIPKIKQGISNRAM